MSDYLTKEQMIQVCKSCLDFDSAMIDTLCLEACISPEDAETFISNNLENIFDI